MKFDSAESVSAKSENSGVKTSDTEGFTPLQLEAIPGHPHFQQPASTFKPFEANRHKSHAKNLPGIPDDSLGSIALGGGWTTFDKAGNIVTWQSKDKSVTRTYLYHDSAQDRAALYGIKGKSVYQDQNGTFFQYAEINGQNTPTAKLFTRGIDARAFADLRGSGRPEGIFQRAVNKDGSPTIEPISLNQNVQISATLDMVTDNQGNIWKRNQTGQPLTEYRKTKDGAEIKSGKSFTDAELLPADFFSDIQHRTLYHDASHPLNSIKAVAVEQRTLRDCYFESAMSDVAKTDPQRIVDMITDNHDGTFTVKFPLSDPSFVSKVDFSQRPTVDVTVEAPTSAELLNFNLPFAREQDFGYWSSVVQKAHRYLTGKISEDEGGSGSDGLQLFTGVRKLTLFEHIGTTTGAFSKQSYSADPRETQPAKVDPLWLIEMKEALEKGEPVVAAAPENGSEWVIVKGGTAHKEVIGRSSEPGKEKDKFQLLDNHIYSVINVEHRDQDKDDLITIRSPLGSVMAVKGNDLARPFDQTNDGYFQVHPKDFENLFLGFFINDTAKQ